MDIALPKYADSYNGYFLMKFTPKFQRQQDILNGKLYFNEIDWFAKCENPGQGDLTEGTSLVENYSDPNYQSLNIELFDGKAFLVQRDYSQNPEEYKPSTVHYYSAAENRKVKIICFYTSFIDVEKSLIQDFPSNMKDEFGNYGVMILNRAEFFDRISRAFVAKPEYYSGYMGFVDYVDMQPGINEWNPFKKDVTRFGYQNEFRIAFKADNPGAITLDIGSIRDIAVPILAEDVDKIHFRDGKLNYPIYQQCT